MLNVLVDEILVAEAEAEEIVRKAEAEARIIKLSADTDLEKRRVEFLNEQKVGREKIYVNAEKDAEKSYDEAVKEAEKEVGGLSRRAEDRMDEAVKLILERLVGK